MNAAVANGSFGNVVTAGSGSTGQARPPQPLPNRGFRRMVMSEQYVRQEAHIPAGRPASPRGMPGDPAGPGHTFPKEASMSTTPAMTMQDLELEHAELLPDRETLWYSSYNGNSSAGFINLLNGNQVQVLSGIGILGSGTAQNGNGNFAL